MKPFSLLTIAWDGTISPCCYDYNIKYPLGNIKETRLRDIWNNANIKRLRKEFITRKVTNELCGPCRSGGKLLNNMPRDYKLILKSKIKAFIKKIDATVKQKTGVSILASLKKALNNLRYVKAQISQKKDTLLLRATTRDAIYISWGGGVHIPIFYHDFNCGQKTKRTTERAIELAITKYWISKNSENIIEIGAVTPYYFPGVIKDIVDPTDKNIHVNIKKSLFDIDLSMKNVISISTVEHIGTGNYNMPINENCIEALDKILKEAKSCLITIPIGFNKILDKYIASKSISAFAFIDIYYRSTKLNNWRHSTDLNKIKHISYGPLWANGIIVISKNPPL